MDQSRKQEAKEGSKQEGRGGSKQQASKTCRQQVHRYGYWLATLTHQNNKVSDKLDVSTLKIRNKHKTIRENRNNTSLRYTTVRYKTIDKKRKSVTPPC